MDIAYAIARVVPDIVRDVPGKKAVAVSNARKFSCLCGNLDAIYQQRTHAPSTKGDDGAGQSDPAG